MKAKKNFFSLLIAALLIMTLAGGISYAAVNNWEVDLGEDFKKFTSKLLKLTEKEIHEIEENEITAAREVGQQLKIAHETPKKVIAKVNGVDVLLSDVMRHRANLEKASKNPMNSFVVTDQMVIEAVIREKVIYAEAKKRGLLPTEQEINEYVQRQKELYEKTREMASKETNKEVVVIDNASGIFNAYFEGMNVSPEEFWEKIAPKEYGRHLITMKLMDKITSQVEPDKKWEVWEQFVKDLCANADVVVLDADNFPYKE